jgi:hypothetical protein
MCGLVGVTLGLEVEVEVEVLPSLRKYAILTTSDEERPKSSSMGEVGRSFFAINLGGIIDEF